MFVVELVHEVGGQIVAAGALVAFQEHGSRPMARKRTCASPRGRGTRRQHAGPSDRPDGHGRRPQDIRDPPELAENPGNHLVVDPRAACRAGNGRVQHRTGDNGSHAHASVIGHLPDRLGFPFVEPRRQCQLALTIVRPLRDMIAPNRPSNDALQAKPEAEQIVVAVDPIYRCGSVLRRSSIRSAVRPMLLPTCRPLHEGLRRCDPFACDRPSRCHAPNASRAAHHRPEAVASSRSGSHSGARRPLRKTRAAAVATDIGAVYRLTSNYVMLNDAVSTLAF